MGRVLHRRLLIAISALVLLVSGWVGAGTAVATPARQAPAQARSGAGSGAPVEESHFADMTLGLRPDGRVLSVRLKAAVPITRGSLQFVIIAGGQARSTRPVALGTMKAGHVATESIPVTLPKTGRMVLGARLSAVGGAPQAQYFVAESRDGGYVTAGSTAELADAGLARDLATGHITRAQFTRAYHRLHEAPGFTRSTLRIRRPPRPASPQASTDATITGTITYQDVNGTPYPVRNAWIGITANSSTTTVVSGRTNSDGTYSLTFLPADCNLGVAYELVLKTDDGVGTITDTSGNEHVAYSQSYFTPCPGQSVSGVNVAFANNNETGKSFALLDALDTVGSYYTSIRQSGWPGGLAVDYPWSGQGQVTSGNQISVAGADAQCGGTACPEQAFDWDALAHESGHVVQYDGGFKSGVGGGHEICANAWGNLELGATSALGKADALGLAWNEGWATFYGLTALQAEGWPAGMPNVKAGIYNDAVGGVSYGIDDNGTNDPAAIQTCTPSGDDSELAVQRALWELSDSDTDGYGGGTGWTMAFMLSTFESAKPQTFPQAYAALYSAAGLTSTSVNAKTAALAVTFTALKFAPTVTVTPNSSSVTVSWTPGGDSGYTQGEANNGTAHPNNEFIVRWVNTRTGSIIAQDTTTATSYTTSASEWTTILSTPSVSVAVEGEQTTAPASGPYESVAKPVTIGSATPDSGLDSMFGSYGDNATCADWSGGDATNSVDLGGGERAWFFSDTLLNNQAARKSLWYASAIHNSIVIQNGSQLVSTITGGNTCQETNTSLSFWDRYALTPATAPDAGGFYWTGDQMIVGSNVVKFYYHGYGIGLPNGGTSFTIDYPAVATIPVSSLETTSNAALTITPSQVSCGPPGIIWGTSLLSWNGSVYIYGWSSTGALAGGIYLAQATAANLASPGSWQLYDGMSGSTPVWGSCGSTPAALPISNPTTGFSVSSVNGSLWLIQFDYTNGQLNAAGPIAAHPSSTPWGFTSSSVPLYSPPTGYVAYPDYYADYEARLQPGLGPSGDVVISYNVNTGAVDTGCVSANAHDATIYRPRFIDVPISAFNPAAASTAVAVTRASRMAASAGLKRQLSGMATPLFSAVPQDRSAPGARLRATTGTGTARPATPAVRAADAADGIDGSTDWFDMGLGGTCPAIGAPAKPAATVDPTGLVNLSWPSVGTDVWYYIYYCDETANPSGCATAGTASPWGAAWSTPQGSLWSPSTTAQIDPVGLSTASTGTNTSGHTFAIYVQSFGAGNSSGGGNSPLLSLQVTVQPPAAPTGLTASASSGSSGTTYSLSWQQVTYPSTSVFYTVNYCDSTATSCASGSSVAWTATTPQLGTTESLTFPAGDIVEFCVKASNLGGASACSNVVT